MIMWTAYEPSTNEVKRVHQELRNLLETVVVQQAQSFVERRHPKASLVHISLAHGALEGNRVPSALRPNDGDAAHRWERSPARSCHVENHNAHPTQGARCPRPN
jgi:hypothetical protein